VAAFLGGLLAGAFVGGLLGLAYGFGVYEETDYQWVEKVRQGGHLLVVSASPQEALDVQQLLAGRQVRIVRSTA
jgi:predicted GNAT superfamily acetyltransferase